jgi:hypothetical protein
MRRIRSMRLFMRLTAEGFTPSPEADRATLLRRLSFDLLGLPPSPAEIRETSLTISPLRMKARRRSAAGVSAFRLGARSTAGRGRYADTDGYSGEQYRPWAWRWRDWVIESLNDDLPYDQFTIDQLAGDQLPDATLDQRIATGFHRNALHSRETDVDPEEFRVRKVVECVNVTGAAWLGLTVGCAQCHSHKFDPLAHSEYFGLYAFFNSMDETEVPAPLRSDPAAFAETSLKLAALPIPEQPPQTMAAVLQQRAEVRATYVQLRGDFLSPGPEVQPHTPAVLPELHTAGGVPTRLDLARWLVSPENPLTARVAVNRAWQQLFCRGLVRTENDFGTQGTPPSHAELLDWLASELQVRGWSQKGLIRAIVTSATYRQSAVITDVLAERDPDNRLLARQNRMRHEAEVLRDAALSAAGLLDDQLGGPSFRLPVLRCRQRRRAAVEERTDGGPVSSRIYTSSSGTQLPFLMTFDAPTGTRSARGGTIEYADAALTLLNDPFFGVHRAGRRLVQEADADASRIERAFAICLSRSPSVDEVTDFVSFLRDQCRLLEQQPELVASLVVGAPPEQAADIALWTRARVDEHG